MSDNVGKVVRVRRTVYTDVEITEEFEAEREERQESLDTAVYRVVNQRWQEDPGVFSVLEDSLEEL